MGLYTAPMKSFKVGLEGALLDFGVERLGVGLCPKCLQNSPDMANRSVTAADVEARLSALSASGVREIDYFILDSNQPVDTPSWALWWNGIRNWKKAAADPAASSSSDDEHEEER
jgi:hypothetical protein